ncbi:MAG: hypothetical protein ACWA5R_07490 [bacterium]
MQSIKLKIIAVIVFAITSLSAIAETDMLGVVQSVNYKNQTFRIGSDSKNLDPQTYKLKAGSKIYMGNKEVSLKQVKPGSFVKFSSELPKGKKGKTLTIGELEVYPQ